MTPGQDHEGMMTDVNLDEARRRLEEDRAALVKQLKELGANERGDLTGEIEYSEAFADAGAATGELNETLAIISNLKTELGDVDSALAKLEAGTYGICEDCGKQIDAARLEFRPNSIRCVTCKAAAS